MAKPLLSPALPPPAAPHRVGGLLAAAQPGDTNVRWTSGLMIWHEPTPGWELLTDCPPQSYEHGKRDDLRPTAAVPFTIRTSVTGPRPELDLMAARARARLDAVTSRAIARELWAGDLTREAAYELPAGWDWTNPSPAAGKYTNPHLAGGDADGLASVASVLEAVAIVEQEVGQRLLMGSPYVHVPVAAMPALQDYLIPTGETLRTVAGSLVVADYGYPADGSPAQVYGTGPVTVWTGAAEVLDDPGQVVRLADNRMEVWAERPALVEFDPETLVSCQVEA